MNVCAKENNMFLALKRGGVGGESGNKWNGEKYNGDDC